jgi:long-subunit fatty acid transport protein
MVRRLLTACVSAGVLACSVATSGVRVARAQDINETVTMEDLGLTQRLSAGSRPAALAGAYIALAGDAHALFYNPAGLARVRSTEFHLGFQHQSRTVENVFYGSTTSIDNGTTNLDNLAIAHAVPTVRGSLVFAGGVYRAYTSDIDIGYRGYNTSTATDDDYLLQQGGSIYSYNFGAAIDLSPTVSAGATLSFLHGRISALTQFTYAFVPPPPTGQMTTETVLDDALFDANGIGATLGLMFQPSRALGFGLALGTPVAISLTGDAVQERARYYNAAPDSFFLEVFAIDTDYKLPFTVAGGISVSVKPMVLSAEVSFANWAEAEIGGRQVRDTDLQSVFRNVWAFRTGIEFSLGPAFVRGGYAYTPYPLEYLQADRIERSQLQEATIDAELQCIAGGAGVVVAKVLTLDVSAEYQYGERSIPTLTDTRESYRIVWAASYRR